jgi:hypothetical protein
MKKLLIAVAAMLSLASPVFAQGLPPGVSQQYGTHAFPSAPYENGTVFSKLFGHKDIANTDANTPTNEDASASADRR